MVELSNERIDKIMHEETLKTEDLKTLLRAIYTRYMHLFERYFADIDKLNDKKIAEFRKYHEETKSLMKYYYVDIPHDVFLYLSDYDERYVDKLLGTGWKDYLTENFNKFKKNKTKDSDDEKSIKAKFADHCLDDFYESMDDAFRDSFGSHSKTAEGFRGFITTMIFGENNNKGKG